jgi:hypothetical protein
MRIPDELRKWAGDNTLQDMVLTTYPPQHAVHGVLETLLRIADRIDIAHKHAIGYVDDRDPETMAENGWVRLPKDADGEYIHIGDRVENNERVARIVLTDGSWEPSVYIEKLPNVWHEYFCNEISHYHAPTVEDLLREFAYGLGVPVADSYIAASAAKLRLAGDAE